MRIIITERQQRLVEMDITTRRRVSPGIEYINNLNPQDVCDNWEYGEVDKYVNEVLSDATLSCIGDSFNIYDEDDYNIYGKVYDYISDEYRKDVIRFFYDSLCDDDEQINESSNKPTNPALWSRAKAAAKSKYKVYPSAYANGFASKWYKKRGGGWKKKSTNESEETNEVSSPAQQAAIAINMKKKGIKPKNENVNEDLRRWFKEKWVDVSKKVDGKHPPCGRKDAEGKSYPKCRPSKKVSSETPKVASSYDKDEKKSMTQQKRRAEKKDPKVGTGNKPTMTHYEKK